MKYRIKEFQGSSMPGQGRKFQVEVNHGRYVVYDEWHWTGKTFDSLKAAKGEVDRLMGMEAKIHYYA